MNCRFCNNNNTSFVLSHYDNNNYVDTVIYNLYYCNNCHTYYVDNPPHPEEMSRYYPSTYYAYSAGESPFFKLKNYISKYSFFRKLLLPILLLDTPNTENRSVLDIGCGDGNSLEQLKLLGWEKLYGTEIDDKKVKVLSEKKIVAYNTLDVTSVKVTEPFGLVRISHVLEHVYNPKDTLHWVYENLDAGGKILIGVPNANSIAFKLFQKYWCGLQLPTHLTLYTKSLEKELSLLGFSEVRSATTGFSGIAMSIIFMVKDRYKTNIPQLLKYILILIFLPLELILNLAGYGYIIYFEGTK